MDCVLCKNNPVKPGLSQNFFIGQKPYYMCFGCRDMLQIFGWPECLNLYLDSSFTESMTFWEFKCRLDGVSPATGKPDGM